jgi:hypothetical protein
MKSQHITASLIVTSIFVVSVMVAAQDRFHSDIAGWHRVF